MPKNIHEVRDPIHVFVRLDSDERKVLDSRPLQRLRHIHQLAMSYLVYPGATHKRFEHSLGVMELAGRVFDVVTKPENTTDEIRNLLEPISVPDKLAYWRRVLRMAALCHDVGHLPFSHSTERLLPDGWNHEHLTREFVSSEEMEKIWCSTTPPLRTEDVVKLAVGPKKVDDLNFNDWEAILSEIIVGDAFGVDRMDYLLRDSHHAGVAYGKFDHYRLIDTLRILPKPRSQEEEGSQEPVLGVEEGGIQSAEALMLARYFMFSQVYLHPVRRSYDIHLEDFLKERLPGGFFSTDPEDHLKITDNEITAELREAAAAKDARGHLHARRIVRREHFKQLYERNPDDVQINPESGDAIFGPLCDEFGQECFRRDRYYQQGGAPDFPVLLRDGRLASSLSISAVLKTLPILSVDFIFADRSIFYEADTWLKNNRQQIIRPLEEDKEESNGQNGEGRVDR